MLVKHSVVHQSYTTVSCSLRDAVVGRFGPCVHRQRSGSVVHTMLSASKRTLCIRKNSRDPSWYADPTINQSSFRDEGSIPVYPGNDWWWRRTEDEIGIEEEEEAEDNCVSGAIHSVTCDKSLGFNIVFLPFFLHPVDLRSNEKPDGYFSRKRQMRDNVEIILQYHHFFTVN